MRLRALAPFAIWGAGGGAHTDARRMQEGEGLGTLRHTVREGVWCMQEGRGHTHPSLAPLPSLLTTPPALQIDTAASQLQEVVRVFDLPEARCAL